MEIVSNMLDTLKEFFGIDSRYEEEEEYTEYDPQEEMDGQTFINSNASSDRQPELTKISAHSNNQPNRKETKMNNVIGMPGLNGGNSEVVVIEPHSFEEMPQVIIALRERKSVVLNLNVMNPEEAQRAVDFIAGGTYAMDGHQERVGESIFLFTPSSVKVSSLSGILKDVHTSETHVRRTTPAPDAWGQQPQAAAQ